MRLIQQTILLSKCSFSKNLILGLGRCHKIHNQAVSLSRSIFVPKDHEGTHSIKEPLVILHGLFGSKANWKSLAKAIADKSKRKVYTLDARNHGESPHIDDCSYEAMILDLQLFLEEEKLDGKVIVLGHSMGGRTAMFMALQNPNKVKRLIVVDVSPIAYYNSPTAQIIELLKNTKNEIQQNVSLSEARRSFDKALSVGIESLSLRQFLLTNLIEENGVIRLRINIDAIDKYFESNLMKFPATEKTYQNPTLFICGGESEYVKPEHHSIIYKMFPAAKLNFIKGAGHWVHAEKPIEFINTLLPFLNIEE